MSFPAANPAGLPHLSPCLVERANAGLPTCNGGGELPPFCGGHACSYRTAITTGFRGQGADENFALARVCHYVSRLMLGHCFGVFPAPGGARSSASPSAPLRGLGSSRNRFASHGKRRPRKLLSSPSEKADLRPWEPDPLGRLRPV